uniref:Uncharacterized protein n=1 Tax=Glossina austeni TaxID=7395 RepID=A0A1A9VLH7_GLOAU
MGNCSEVTGTMTTLALCTKYGEELNPISDPSNYIVSIQGNRACFPICSTDLNENYMSRISVSYCKCLQELKQESFKLNESVPTFEFYMGNKRRLLIELKANYLKKSALAPRLAEAGLMSNRARLLQLFNDWDNYLIFKESSVNNLFALRMDIIDFYTDRLPTELVLVLYVTLLLIVYMLTSVLITYTYCWGRTKIFRNLLTSANFKEHNDKQTKEEGCTCLMTNLLLMADQSHLSLS